MMVIIQKFFSTFNQLVSHINGIKGGLENEYGNAHLL